MESKSVITKNQSDERSKKREEQTNEALQQEIDQLLKLLAQKEETDHIDILLRIFGLMERNRISPEDMQEQFMSAREVVEKAMTNAFEKAQPDLSDLLQWIFLYISAYSPVRRVPIPL